MKKNMALIILFILLVFSITAIADVGPDWMAGGDDAEQKIGSITQKIFKGVVMFAAAIAAIALAWGLVEYHGLIGDKDTGVKRIKGGIVGICASGLIYAVVSFFAKV